MPRKPIAKKRGRPAVKLDPGQVYKLAVEGLTQARIATKCGVSRATLQNHIAKDKKLRQAYDRGTADFLSLVEKCLGEKALDGDISAIKFILQTRDKKNYSLRQEITGADGGEIQIAARPMTPAERKAAVKEVRQALEADY